MMRIFLITAVLLLLGSCRYLGQVETQIEEGPAFNCGHWEDRTFASEVTVHEYPDLGDVLDYSAELGLTLEQQRQLRIRAAECYSQCSAQKQSMTEEWETVKAKAREGSVEFGSMAAELAFIREQRLRWLMGHSQRYHDGLDILTESQKEIWKKREEHFEPLP